MFKIIQHATNQNPKVSIVTPMHNVEEFIEEQLESLLSQTLENIEIILIDDGSTDNTLKVVSAIGDKNKDKVTVVTKDNGGASSARNIGLSIFRGEYLFFADSDDVVPNQALEFLYKAAVKHSVDIVTGRSVSFNSTN